MKKIMFLMFIVSLVSCNNSQVYFKKETAEVNNFSTPIDSPPQISLSRSFVQLIQNGSSESVQVSVSDKDSHVSCSDLSISHHSLVISSLSGEEKVCLLQINPAPDKMGEGKLTLTLDNGNSTTATLNFNIARGDQAPIAQDLVASMTMNQQTTLSLQHSDPDGDEVTKCKIYEQLNVSATCSCQNGLCQAIVTGDQNYIGDARFSYSVFANDKESNQAEVSIKISDSTVDFEIEDPDKVDCDSLKVSNIEHDLELKYTVDDASDVWINGDFSGSSNDWRKTFTIKKKIKSGCHVIAIKGKDVMKFVSGMIASLKIDGKIVWVSGPDSNFLKVFGPAEAPSNWYQFNFNDSSWGRAQKCSDTTIKNYWSGANSELVSEGATWVWYPSENQTSTCGGLRQAFFRISFTISN